MIVRDHLPWTRVWPSVSYRLGLLFVFDFTIAALYTFGGVEWLALTALPLSTMGAAISIFLAFRTNAAYERWWEARILWGGMVNWARSLARESLILISENSHPEARQLQRKLVLQTIAFVCALRCFLRRQNPFPELTGLLGPEAVSELRKHDNVPNGITMSMGRDVRMAYERGWIDSYRWVRFEESLTKLTDIQGGCERIKNTPMPRQYDFFPRVLVGFYCLLLPFGLVEGLGMMTPLASTAISFIFIMLDTIGRDIENPFENTVHDTPMTALSRTIEINLRQQLGETPRLRPVQPVSGFVY